MGHRSCPGKELHLKYEVGIAYEYFRWLVSGGRYDEARLLRVLFSGFAL